jgi:hypothetical protein
MQGLQDLQDLGVQMCTLDPTPVLFVALYL